MNAIAPGHRSLLDRVSGLILAELPQASVERPSLTMSCTLSSVQR
jgi:hypothetical protein